MSLMAGMQMNHALLQAANSGGAPGGGTAGEGAGAAPAAGGGMGAYGGLALLLGGSLMDYYGQRKGASAMLAEAERQAAEQEVFTAEKRKLFEDELLRYDPNAQAALASGGFLRSQAATRPALAAGGKALGLNAGSVASVGRGLLPLQRVSAHQGAATGQDARLREGQRRLSIDTAGVQDRQDMASALYPMRNQRAGMVGAEWRTGGQVLQGGGMPLIMHSMAQK